MVFARKRSNLNLTQETTAKLTTVSRSRSEEKRRVERAQILLKYHQGQSVLSIAKEVGVHRNTVNKLIDKALEFGAITALDDLQRSGRGRKIGPEARAWVVSLACRSPRELGYPHELWTHQLLCQHVRRHCEQEGHSSLENLARGTIAKILNAAEIRPHKIRYYLERRDEHFETKMAQVLHVYKEVELLRAQNREEIRVAMVSYDEKPGIQALEKVAPDLPPKPGKYSWVSRDYEYKRHGTVALLAAIDLFDGHVLGMVKDRHRSVEFVSFLKELDTYYKDKDTIRVILDNHSCHISKETQAYLRTMPNRFEFVFTPTHGSWLNLIESFFAKLAKTVLRGIRVKSKAELEERILAALEWFNQEPVIFKWGYKMDEITLR